MKFISFVSFCIAAVAAHPVFADDAHHTKTPAASVAQAVPMTQGEVRKIDKAAKKITLKHGPIVNLGMPAMTMVFQVADAAMLDQFKAGDKVKFSADKVGGAFSVTKMEPAVAGESSRTNPPVLVVAEAAAMTEGEVRKVDKPAKKITLKHGPILNLDMPAMTMVYQVADPAMLEQVKAGDKVRFSADKAGSGYAVTKIEQEK